MLAGLAVLFGLCCGLACCGYKVSSALRADKEPRTLCIPVLENNTTEGGLGTLMANDMIRWLARDRRLVLSQSTGADFVLKARIVSLHESNSSRRSEGASTGKRLRLTLSVTLLDKSGKAIWTDGGFADSEDYIVMADDFQATQENRKQALSALSARLAEKARDRIEAYLDNF